VFYINFQTLKNKRKEQSDSRRRRWLVTSLNGSSRTKLLVALLLVLPMLCEITFVKPFLWRHRSNIHVDCFLLVRFEKDVVWQRWTDLGFTNPSPIRQFHFEIQIW